MNYSLRDVIKNKPSFFIFRDYITEIIEYICYNKATINKKIKNRKEINIMSALKINKDNFENVKNSEKPVLLDFYADWCGPCRMVSPLVDQIADENPNIVVGKVNVDNEPELAQMFGVFSIPSLIVLKSGKVVNKSVGARPKAQILEMLNV